MIDLIIYVWQLPQNLLGLAVIKTTKAKAYSVRFDSKFHFNYMTNAFTGAVSLGEYVIIGKYSMDTKIERHEFGHQRQSRMLGWLYLPLIGVPSFLGAAFSRLFLKKWSNEKRRKWYHSLPWEKWADILGGVNEGK